MVTQVDANSSSCQPSKAEVWIESEGSLNQVVRDSVLHENERIHQCTFSKTLSVVLSKFEASLHQSARLECFLFFVLHPSVVLAIRIGHGSSAVSEGHGRI